MPLREQGAPRAERENEVSCGDVGICNYLYLLRFGSYFFIFICENYNFIYEKEENSHQNQNIVAGSSSCGHPTSEDKPPKKKRGRPKKTDADRQAEAHDTLVQIS